MEAKKAGENIVIENGVLMVSGKSQVGAVAGAISHSLNDSTTVEIRTIGAGALNQAIKAIAKARGSIATRGKDLIVQPGFGNTLIEGEERTVIVLVCKVI